MALFRKDEGSLSPFQGGFGLLLLLGVVMLIGGIVIIVCGGINLFGNKLAMIIAGCALIVLGAAVCFLSAWLIKKNEPKAVKERAIYKNKLIETALETDRINKQKEAERLAKALEKDKLN